MLAKFAPIGILVAVLLAGIYILSSNVPSNAHVQKKNIDAMVTGTITPLEKRNDLSYFPETKGYFVRPQSDGAYPGVVMIHENRGLRPEIKKAADELAKEGYIVLAVDLYKGKVVEKQEDARALSSGFDQKTGTENLKAAVQYLRDQGAIKIASLGWCFGGRQSVELAISGEKLDATVVYYGGGMASTTERLAPISWPVLGIFGEKDTAIPQEKIKEFDASLTTLGVTHDIHIYPGVGHAFANPSGANYAPIETKDAWEKTIAFLKKHLSTN